MIFTLMTGVIATMALLPIALLSAIAFVLPDGIIYTFQWAFNYMVYLKGDLPIYADPTMTGPVSQIGLIDIIIGGFTLAIWLLGVRYAGRIVSMLPLINLRIWKDGKSHI